MNAPEQASHPRANYALGLLFVVYAFSLIDRQILAMLLEPIKEEMELRDWHLGFLSGLAFALFYSTLGIPLARVADRGSRRNVIVIGMIVWSIATCICGAARSFWHLALARVGVGAGEAAGGPPSHSMISDLFPPHKRARALAIYTIGSNTGIMAGFMLGGLAVGDDRLALDLRGRRPAGRPRRASGAHHPPRAGARRHRGAQRRRRPSPPSAR